MKKHIFYEKAFPFSFMVHFMFLYIISIFHKSWKNQSSVGIICYICFCLPIPIIYAIVIQKKKKKIRKINNLRLTEIFPKSHHYSIIMYIEDG